MKNKKLIAALVALVVVVGLMAGIYLTTRPETAQGAKTITVTVVHKDGTVQEFICHTDEEFLAPALLAEGIVTGEDGPYGLMIESADGEVADWNVDQSYWAVFIGEEYATTGVSEIPVYDGAVYKLVYTIG